MGNQIQSIALVASSALLAVLGIASPIGSASAANDCIAAPNSEAPPGSHWYYRSDRTTQRKCWHLGTERRYKPAGLAQVGARDLTADTVGVDRPHRQTTTPSTPGSTGDTLTRRECDTELSVLQYRKILTATLSDVNSTNNDIDMRMVELAAKGCRKPSRAGEATVR
jgi:hypothetical protein